MPCRSPVRPHLQQVLQLHVESPGLLLKLVDGVLVLLHVPFGALIKGLPVTLWGRQRSLSLDRWVALLREKAYLVAAVLFVFTKGSV